MSNRKIIISIDRDEESGASKNSISTIGAFAPEEIVYELTSLLYGHFAITHGLKSPEVLHEDQPAGLD